MAVIFHKLHSSGNDFIVLTGEENPNLEALQNESFIKKICHRNFGIGADGIFFVTEEGNVRHFDSDGSESFCVNGSLCLAYLKKKFNFIPESFSLKVVRVKIENSDKPSVSFFCNIKEKGYKTVEGVKGLFVDIGNPHFFVNGFNVDRKLAKTLRNSGEFKEGANISFFEHIDDDTVKIATFERGVEDFTLACGSACAAFCAGFERKNVSFIPLSGIGIKVLFDGKSLFIEGEVEYVAKGNYFI